MNHALRSVWGAATAQSVAAGAAASKLSRQEQQIEELTRRVDRLSLACQALWELLRESTALNDATLHRKMTEIDLRDGAHDGRVAMSVIECPQCGNRTNSRRKQCIFCGAAVPGKHTFA